MKSDVFIYTYQVNKTKLKNAKEMALELIKISIITISQALSISKFYYQEIRIQSRNFKNNFKYRNRF